MKVSGLDGYEKRKKEVLVIQHTCSSTEQNSLANSTFRIPKAFNS